MSIRIFTFFLIITSFSLNFSDSIKRESLFLPHSPVMEFHNQVPIEINQQKWDKFLFIWNKKIENTWNKIYQALLDETGISTEVLKFFMKTEVSKGLYKIMCKNKADKILKNGIEEKEIDPVVLSFIKETTRKYTSKKNIKIILVPKMSLLTGTFGSDDGEHYILCQQETYNRENIEAIYESRQNKSASFHFELTENKENCRVINMENLLTIGLAESALHVEHESNFFSFVLSNIPLNGEKASDRTSGLCHFLTNTQMIFEAILQSKNPLEAAMFLKKQKKQIKEKKKFGISSQSNFPTATKKNRLNDLKRLLKSFSVQNKLTNLIKYNNLSSRKKTK